MATVETINIPAYRVTGAGWRTELDSQGRPANITYSDQELLSVYQIFVEDDLDGLLRSFKSRTIPYPNKDTQIRLERGVVGFNLGAQVDALDLDWLDANYNNLVRLCKFLGIPRLMRNLFVAGKINLNQLGNITAYLLGEKKVSRQRMENMMDWLEANSHITTAQKTAFWAAIDAL